MAQPTIQTITRAVSQFFFDLTPPDPNPEKCLSLCNCSNYWDGWQIDEKRVKNAPRDNMLSARPDHPDSGRDATQNSDSSANLKA